MVSSWLDEHLETFVRPYLGFVPNIEEYRKSIQTASGSVINSFDGTYVKHFDRVHLETLVALWEAAKVQCGSREMLLPGRDTFLFEILARIDDYPTTFCPDLSSATKVGYARIKGRSFKDCFLIDSGHAGSIPKALEIENYGLVYSSGVPPKPLIPSSNGIQSTSGPIYSIYSYLEGCPKYWVRATLELNKQGYSTGKIIPQVLSSKDEFTRAAILTQHVARYYMSSKWINHTVAKSVRSVGRYI